MKIGTRNQQFTHILENIDIECSSWHRVNNPLLLLFRMICMYIHDTINEFSWFMEWFWFHYLDMNRRMIDKQAIDKESFNYVRIVGLMMWNGKEMKWYWNRNHCIIISYSHLFFHITICSLFKRHLSMIIKSMIEIHQYLFHSLYLSPWFDVISISKLDFTQMYHL